MLCLGIFLQYLNNTMNNERRNELYKLSQKVNYVLIIIVYSTWNNFFILSSKAADQLNVCLQTKAIWHLIKTELKNKKQHINTHTFIGICHLQASLFYCNTMQNITLISLIIAAWENDNN